MAIKQINGVYYDIPDDYLLAQLTDEKEKTRLEAITEMASPYGDVNPELPTVADDVSGLAIGATVLGSYASDMFSHDNIDVNSFQANDDWSLGEPTEEQQAEINVDKDWTSGDTDTNQEQENSADNTTINDDWALGDTNSEVDNVDINPEISEPTQDTVDNTDWNDDWSLGTEQSNIDTVEYMSPDSDFSYDSSSSDGSSSDSSSSDGGSGSDYGGGDSGSGSDGSGDGGF